MYGKKSIMLTREGRCKVKCDNGKIERRRKKLSQADGPMALSRLIANLKGPGAGQKAEVRCKLVGSRRCRGLRPWWMCAVIGSCRRAAAGILD